MTDTDRITLVLIGISTVGALIFIQGGLLAFVVYLIVLALGYGVVR